MKKFLRLDLPGSDREIPGELDASILAYAAIRARAVRYRRLAWKLTMPVLAAGAAAAVAVIAVLPATQLPDGGQDNRRDPIQQQNLAVRTQDNIRQTVSNAELLALADTTVLEQESYNLASMGEYSFDSDIFTI